MYCFGETGVFLFPSLKFDAYSVPSKTIFFPFDNYDRFVDVLFTNFFFTADSSTVLLQWQCFFQGFWLVWTYPNTNWLSRANKVRRQSQFSKFSSMFKRFVGNSNSYYCSFMAGSGPKRPFALLPRGVRCSDNCRVLIISHPSDHVAYVLRYRIFLYWFPPPFSSSVSKMTEEIWLQISTDFRSWNKQNLGED